MTQQDRFFHPWHSVSTGENVPQKVNSIIEIQQGSKAKYELDKLTGFLSLDRILACNLVYPFHYGFIPQTYGLDNDPLDILLICSENLIPLSIVQAIVLGGVKMIDDNQPDDKIIAVAAHDPFMSHIKNLNDMNPEILNSIEHFFKEYKIPENKEVVIQGFMPREQAYQCIEDSIVRYKKKFPKKPEIINS